MIEDIKDAFALAGLVLGLVGFAVSLMALRR